MTAPQGTLLLTHGEIAGLLTLAEYRAVVEAAFRAHAEGRVLASGLLHLDAVGGEFHVKAGGLRGDRAYVAVKVNGGFFQNAARHGLPNIQGVIVLADGERGTPLALLDSTEITMQRTAAATAVAAAHCARPDAASALVCGCGRQGRMQLRALADVLPLRVAWAWARDASAAEAFAVEMREALGIPVEPVADVRAGAAVSDVIVTCTPSRVPFLDADAVRPGAFVAAVGADAPDKQEVDPALLARNRVVVDLREQCAAVGELHHAIGRGLMRSTDVQANLGELVTGRRPGRTSAEEIVVFDSTGTALQDVAASAAVYERALARGVGRRLRFDA